MDLLKQLQLDTKNVIIVIPKKRLTNLKYNQELMKLDNYMKCNQTGNSLPKST